MAQDDVSRALNFIQNELAFNHTALQERDMAIAEMHRAIGEKNRAILEKDWAIAEMDMAIAEKDEAIAEKDRVMAEKGKAIAEKDMAIAEKDEAIAEKDRVMAEKDMVIEEKDRMILVLEQDKEAFKEEMVFVIKGSITILHSVSEQVLDLVVGLQKFKLKNEDEEMAAIPVASTCSSQEMQAATLLSCGEVVSKRIHFAQCALDEALKQWKIAEARLEILQNYNRNFLLAKILGKEEPAPIS